MKKETEDSKQGISRLVSVDQVVVKPNVDGDVIDRRRLDVTGLMYVVEACADPIKLIKASRMGWLKVICLWPLKPYWRYQTIFNQKVLEILKRMI